METASRTVPLPATDRLRQTLSALTSTLDRAAADLDELETSLQEALAQAAHDAEAAVEAQAAASLNRALEEAEQRIRAEVSAELRGQLDREIAEAVERVRRELAEEREELRRAVERLTKASAAWEKEREKLTADCDSANEMLARVNEEHYRALSDTEQAAALALERQVATAVERARTTMTAEAEKARRQGQESWEAERAQLLAEREKAAQELGEAQAENHELRQAMERRSGAETQREIDEAVARVREDLTGENKAIHDRLQAAAHQWEAEKKQLQMDLEQRKQLLSESEAEHSRTLAEARKIAASAYEREMATAVNRVREELGSESENLRREIERLKRSAGEWESERTRLNDERERANQLLVEAKQEQSRLASAAQAKAAVPSKPVPVLADPSDKASLEAEITRVEELIHSISELIHDPATELSVVIRKNAERAELKAYLQGIRFKAGK
jgi:chromosome segregation ATPase